MKVEMEWSSTNGDHAPPSNSHGRSNARNNTNHSNFTSTALRDDDPPASAYIECQADFRVLAQTVVITDVSFLNESFKVFTELSIVPLVSDLSSINLHLGKFALLPSDLTDSGGRVTVNDIEAQYSRVEDSLDSNCPVTSGNLRESMSATYSTLKKNDTQLHIRIPRECAGRVRSMGCLKVGINVVVRRPRTGVQFSYSIARDGSLEKGAHVFTYKSALLAATHEWLPCQDSPDQLALWQLHVTCDAAHTAIASAELMDVEMSGDLRTKTFHYQQSVPTSACNMGWAIGQFTTYGHPDLAEVTSFALPGLLALVKHTVSPLDKVLEYFEELLSCRYPYPSYKQVFVDKTPDEVTSYSSLTIFSVNILYHKKIIDVVQESRQLIAFGAAQQFFGGFIVPADWTEWWLLRSLARLVTSMYVQKIFGTSEFMYQIRKTMSTVIDYESQWGKILLHPPQLVATSSRTNLHCDTRHELTSSPLYADASAKKGHLVMRMLLKRIGKEPFLQVLHKVLTVGQQMSERRDRPASWTHMVLSTEAFFRTVSSVTGNEIPTFLEQWIYSGGHVAFQIQYTFNRKRNMIELDVRQDISQGNGRLRYVGPLTVVVQELDGSFSHTVQIDGDISRSDLQCHSKGRRQKRKKVPLYTGEEVEVDLTSMDPDSPVLWIRADPELLLLRDLNIRQPNYQWEYMLKYERDVLAQLQALERLQQFPSAQSRNVLLETITNDMLFYRVRCRAAYSLSVVLTRMSEAWGHGQPDLIDIFRRQFGSKACALIPRSNNFVATSQNLQQYFLMQALPQAVAQMRTQSGQCLPDVLTFVLDLIRFNDNSTNRYSDDHYRTALITAIVSMVVPAQVLGGTGTPDAITPDAARILQELTLALNMDTMKPSFGRVVGIAALTGIYQLQRHGHIPHDSKIFWLFAAPKICVQMRKASLSLLVDRVATVRDRMASEDLMRLLSMAEEDGDPAVRIHIPTQLAVTPPFGTSNNSDYGAINPCNTQPLAMELWRLLHGALDVRARLLYADIYFSLYGLGVPPVRGGPAVAPGHHRLYVGVGATAGMSSSTLDDDRADSPVRNRDNSFSDDILQ